jgi:hypothetical protein
VLLCSGTLGVVGRDQIGFGEWWLILRTAP